MAEERDIPRTHLATGHMPETRPEQVREDMEVTRASLTEKLETLEHRVVGTVEAAQHKVEHGVDAVRETVENVKRTFNVKHHVEERPWLMLGASVLTGYALGQFIMAGHGRSEPKAGTNGRGGTERAPAPAMAAEPRRPAAKSRFVSQIEDELGRLQTEALGLGMNLLRGWLKQVVSSFEPRQEPLTETSAYEGREQGFSRSRF